MRKVAFAPSSFSVAASSMAVSCSSGDQMIIGLSKGDRLADDLAE
jgi:hypothetical protein